MRNFIWDVHCKSLILSEYEVLKVMKVGWCKHVIELPAEALVRVEVYFHTPLPLSRGELLDVFRSFALAIRQRLIETLF